MWVVAKIKRTGNSAYSLEEKYAITTEVDAYTINITNDAKTLPTLSLNYIIALQGIYPSRS